MASALSAVILRLSVPASRRGRYNRRRSRPDSRVARKRIEESPGSIGQSAR